MFVRHYAVLMGPDLPVTFDGCSAQIFVIELKAGNCRHRAECESDYLPRSEREKVELTGAGRRHEAASNRLQTGKGIAIRLNSLHAHLSFL
jgi:hypothetical protein